MRRACRALKTVMRSLEEIHTEIETLARRERSEPSLLSHRLSDQHDPEVRAEIHAIDAKLDRLWDEHRAVRARLRFGDRDSIVAHARVEEQLSARRRRSAPNRPLHWSSLGALAQLGEHLVKFRRTKEVAGSIPVRSIARSSRFRLVDALHHEDVVRRARHLRHLFNKADAPWAGPVG